MNASMWLDYWDRVRQGTLATVDLFLEDELGFAPVAGGYTVRELALHIAHEEEIELLHGLARTSPDLPEPYPPANFPTKLAIVRQLDGVHARTVEFLRGQTDESFLAETELAWGEQLRPIDVVLHLIEHETHHRGELSLVLGLLGRRGFDA
jgi:uncharacterized damage-inducible protein DinB